jgi:hypothetical protein
MRTFYGATEMKSILDPTFKYYPSVDTDLCRTFQRIREEMRHASIARSNRRSRGASGQIGPFAAPRRLRVADWRSIDRTKRSVVWIDYGTVEAIEIYRGFG